MSHALAARIGSAASPAGTTFDPNAKPMARIGAAAIPPKMAVKTMWASGRIENSFGAYGSLAAQNSEPAQAPKAPATDAAMPMTSKERDAREPTRPIAPPTDPTITARETHQPAKYASGGAPVVRTIHRFGRSEIIHWPVAATGPKIAAMKSVPSRVMRTTWSAAIVLGIVERYRRAPASLRSRPKRRRNASCCMRFPSPVNASPNVPRRFGRNGRFVAHALAATATAQKAASTGTPIHAPRPNGRRAACATAVVG